MFKRTYLKKDDAMKKYWVLWVLYRRCKVFEETGEGKRSFLMERGRFSWKKGGILKDFPQLQVVFV